MKKLFTTLSIAIFIATLSFGQTDTDYKESLTTMFAVSGSEELYKVAITQMLSIFKDQFSDVDLATWTELEKEFEDASINDLVDLLVPVYQKYLTIDDIQELIKFYGTPVGKKFATQTPFIMKESMQVGQQWGMKIGQDFAEKMKARGY